jgi:hypothetical protein
MVASRRWQGRRYLQKWPSAKVINRDRARVRSLTNRHMACIPLEGTVDSLNRFLRGWGAYFRHGNSGAKFNQLDSYVHLRLARLEMVRHGRRGWVWSTHYRLLWLRAIGVYRLTELSGGSGACHTVNDVGEPCAGEPHARFDGRALETGWLRSAIWGSRVGVLERFHHDDLDGASRSAATAPALDRTLSSVSSQRFVNDRS